MFKAEGAYAVDFERDDLTSSPATIFTAGLPPQLYLVEVTDERGRRTIRKWLKAR